MARRFLILISTALIAGAVNAQARNTNWVFASGVWLQFTPDNIVSIPMADTVSLRNASISDTAGQFMLLADDFGIRNALFETVEGGSSAELGWSVPAANYLILPLPGPPDQYGVFINEQPPSKRAGFVHVDMNANGGAGAVVGGTTWYMQNVTAKLTATTDSTETGYWVLQHDDEGDAFRAFHLMASGLDPVPVVSHVGTAYLPNTAPKDNIDRWGQMNFSFQGDELGVIKFSDTSLDTCKIELFHFRRALGEVRHWADISANYYTGPLPSGITQALLQGLDFDTSGAYMYVNHVDTMAWASQSAFVQYNLLVPPDSLVTASRFYFASVTGDTLRYDNHHGNQFATGPYGGLIRRIPINPSNGIFNYQDIMKCPIPVTDLGSGGINVIPYTISITGYIGGLPAPCKRYVGSSIGAGISHGQPFSVIGLRPNLVADRAVLVFNGLVQPEKLVWRDALGRVWRRSRVERLGPAFVLDRGNLPSGLYFVEVLGKSGSLGVVKAICE